MEKEKIIEYIKKRKTITVPSVQKRFSLSYNQTTNLFAELVEEGGLFFISGITYNVRAEKLEKAQKTDDDDDIWTLDEYRRKMRDSFRSDDDDDMECDEDIGDDDDESDAYDRILESLRAKEEKRADESEDESKDSLNNMRKRLNNLSKIYHIKRIFSDCINSQIKIESAGGISCNVITIGGEQFKLDYDDGLLQITYEGFAPADCTSAMRADSIIEEYKSLRYKAGTIVATVEDTANSLDVLLELYAAVVRINQGE